MNRVPKSLLTALFTFSAFAHATLDSEAYKRANEAYGKGDYHNAVKLLKAYRSEYEPFLKANPAVLEAVNRAIAYSEGRLSTGMIAGGVKVVPAPPPPLPKPAA